MTHDREFSTAVRTHIVGQHLYLDGRELAARAIVERHLDEVVRVFERRAELWVRVAQDAYSVTFPGETW